MENDYTQRIELVIILYNTTKQNTTQQIHKYVISILYFPIICTMVEVAGWLAGWLLFEKIKKT